MTTVLYDCTRLIARRNSPTPTGIDRVDLQYAVHVLSHHRANSAFVTQHGGALHLVPIDIASLFISQLQARWFQSAGNAPHIDMTDQFRKLGVLDAGVQNKQNQSAKQPTPNQPQKNEAKPTGVTAKDIAEIRDLSIGERWALLRRVKLSSYLPSQFKWFSSAPKPFQLAVFGAISLFPSLLNSMKPRDERPPKAVASFLVHVGAKAAPPEGDKALGRSRIAEPLAGFLATRSTGPVAYLNMSHHGLLDSELFIELRTVHGAEFVIYLHDIIPIDYPEYCRPGSKADHVRRLDNVHKVDAFLIFNSNDTSHRVNSYFERNFGRRPRSMVSYIGADNVTRTPDQKRSIFSGPYFVIVGTIEGRKNHLGLLQVWREMASRSEIVPKLVIIGKRGWNNTSVLEMLDLCEAIQPHVLELNDLADDELFSIVSSASAMLFPSFSEGWGMPLVEALSLGVPVICSDIPVFREASQGFGEFIHPLDLKGWESAVLEYAQDGSETRAKAIERLKEYRPPAWQDMFDQLDAVLEDVKKSATKPPIRRHNYTEDRQLAS